MLQSVRDNMKGTLVAGGVILFFIVPLVLTGMGNEFLGSAVGTDAASVNGKNITKEELRRAVFMQKQRLLAQEGVDPSAEYLQDENLQGPALERLTQRFALLVSAERGGMGVSDEAINSQILQQEQFHQDGKFSTQTYRRLLANYGYTPASYKETLEQDTLVAQMTGGVSLSGFTTEVEVNALIALLQQKRSFFSIKIPKTLVEKDVDVTGEQVKAHYEENSSDFMEEEKISVSYLELSLSEISKSIEVSEEDIKAQYEADLASFDESVEYDISHILIEAGDDQASDVAAVSEKLAAGDNFEALVAEYSDDSGSSALGGSLGVMLPGTYPEALENAVYELEQGQVSSAVETEAGIHFVKVNSKVSPEAPVYEDRKDAIKTILQQSLAEDLYSEQLDLLEELTYDALDLSDAASQLGLTVKTTALFGRNSGSGVANNAQFRELAFDEEVLSNGNISKRLEMSDGVAVVVQKLNYVEEHVKAFELVESEIKAKLTTDKIDEFLSERSSKAVESLYTGTDASAIASSNGYEFASFDEVKRGAPGLDFAVSKKAFEMILKRGGKPSYEADADRDGNHIVVGLLNVIPGTSGDMQDLQVKGLRSQLKLQGAGFEVGAYQNKIIADSEIKVF